ncbi:MAG: hypothetical protein QOE30_2144 [Mycobacterium sp.]|nr:hypothetical protein [Mycobacterium sp.]
MKTVSHTPVEATRDCQLLRRNLVMLLLLRVDQALVLVVRFEVGADRDTALPGVQATASRSASSPGSLPERPGLARGPDSVGQGVD